jgi:hypothetical protein
MTALCHPTYNGSSGAPLLPVDWGKSVDGLSSAWFNELRAIRYNAMMLLQQKYRSG